MFASLDLADDGSLITAPSIFYLSLQVNEGEEEEEEKKSMRGKLVPSAHVVYSMFILYVKVVILPLRMTRVKYIEKL